MNAAELQKVLTRPFPADKVKQKRGQGNRTMSYISHGLVTERLNEADPNWSSEILTEHIYKDQHGVPHCAGVTISLTVHGVTRVEAGGPQRQDGFTNEIKNAYSDALKRAAMRFGVALEMWESLLDAEGDEDYDEGHAVAPQSAPQPRVASFSQQRPPAPQNANGAEYNWQDFWAWARSQNLGSPQAIEGMIGQPISGMSPNQIRDAIQHAQTQQRPTQAPQNGNQRRDPVQSAQTGSPASDRQLGFMVRLARDAGWQDGELDFWIQDTYGVRRNELDKRTASQIIEKLQAGEVSRPESEQGMFQGMPEPDEPVADWSER